MIGSLDRAYMADRSLPRPIVNYAVNPSFEDGDPASYTVTTAFTGWTRGWGIVKYAAGDTVSVTQFIGASVDTLYGGMRAVQVVKVGTAGVVRLFQAIPIRLYRRFFNRQFTVGIRVATNAVGIARLGMVGYKVKGTRAYQSLGSHVSTRGDILADPAEILALSTFLIGGLGETVRGLGGDPRTLELGIWSLSIQQTEEWDRLRDEARAAEERADLSWIEDLPYKFIDPEDEEYDALMSSNEFISLENYSRLIFTVPGELGHDNEYRYTTVGLWPAQEPTVTP